MVVFINILLAGDSAPGEEEAWCMLVSQPECETERVRSKCPKTCNGSSGN